MNGSDSCIESKFIALDLPPHYNPDIDAGNPEMEIEKQGGLFHFPLIKKQLKSANGFPDYRAKSRWYR